MMGFFAPVSARTVQAVACGFAALWLYELWDLRPVLHLLLGTDGLYARPPGYAEPPSGLLNVLWSTDARGIEAWFWLSVAAGISVLLEPTRRLACAAIVLSVALMNHRNPYIGFGADYVLAHLGFWLALAPSSRRPEAPGWAIRALRLQIALVYLIAGLMKLTASRWLDGTALHYGLQVRHVATGLFDAFLLDHPGLTAALTWAGLSFELAFPFAVFVGPLRRWALLAALSFHTGIELLVSVPYFGPGMVCGLVAFLEQSDWERLSRLTHRYGVRYAAGESGGIETQGG